MKKKKKAKNKTKNKNMIKKKWLYRQNGIVANPNKLDTILMEIYLGNGKEFDISFENNTDIYLTQRLAFTRSNNLRFQHDNDSSSKSYQGAPVKLYDRCVIKATADYGNESLPWVGNICNFLMFSVYNDCKSLLNGVNKFINNINNENIKYLKDCLIPNVIIRIQNGLIILYHLPSINDEQYCDIKLSIIYKQK